MSVQSLIARFQNRSCAVLILASASATLVATVRKVPTIACAAILWTLLMGPMSLSLYACIHTLEA